MVWDECSLDKGKYSINMLMYVDPFEEKTQEEIDAMEEFARRRYERRKNVADAKARNRELLFEGKFDA